MKDNYKEDNFDSIIKQKMTTLEGVPAFDAWDNIAAELDRDQSPFPKIWWGTGSVLLLLIVGGLVFWNKNTLFENKEQVLTNISTIKTTSEQTSNFVPLDRQQNSLSSSNKSSNSSKKRESENKDLFKHVNDKATKTEHELSQSDTYNSPKKIKNNIKQNQVTKSNKTVLLNTKKEENNNSIKNDNALISEEDNLSNDTKTEKIALTEGENIKENIVTSKDIKLLKVGLIKLNNDLQLLDYQSLVSKNTSKEVEIKNATRLAFSFTPLRTYKQLIPNLDDDIIVTGFENTESLKTRTSFALTLGMERELNERWEAEWGVNYTRIEQNMNFLYTKKSTPITILFDTNENGFDTRPTRDKERFSHNYAFNYLGIYGGVSYRIFRYAKPEQRVGARLSVSTLLNKDESLNKLQESFTTFYKVSYQLSPYWRFNVSPEFTYYFRSTYKKEAFLGAKPYTVGLQLGLVRRFRGKKNK